MKTNRIVGRCILAGFFAYLLLQIYYLSCYLLPSVKEETLEGVIFLFLVQSILLAAGILAVFILIFVRMRKDQHHSPFSSFVLISGSGKIIKKILLQDQRSFVITGKKNGKEVFVGGPEEAGEDRYLYGVLNLISGCWYLEVAKGSRPVGLRRGGGGVVFRLKEGIPYPLSKTDVIYADTCKIAVREKNTRRDKNGSDSL